MRILNQQISSSSQVAKKQSIIPKSEKNIVSEEGGRKIIKMEKPASMSDSQVRAKIEELKAKKEEKLIEVKKDDLVTAMPDNLEVKTKSSIIKNNAQPAEVAVETKTTPEVVTKEVPKEATSPEKKSHTLKSDVDLNDPRDTNVHEKLRTILKSGGFNFSQKEKEALGQILNK